MGEPPGQPSRAQVAATYDRIATHFATTRSRPWNSVESFVAEHGGGRALDVGCGNGRHFGILQGTCPEVIGLDLSRQLLGIAAEEWPEVLLIHADAGSLPIRTGSIDLGLCVATLHHLPARRARIAALGELARVLHVDGRALVTCWSVSHDKFDAESGHDRWVDWTLPSGTVVPRYYHLYDLAEFTAELEESPVQIERIFERDGNCYGIVSAANG